MKLTDYDREFLASMNIRWDEGDGPKVSVHLIPNTETPRVEMDRDRLRYFYHAHRASSIGQHFSTWT